MNYLSSTLLCFLLLVFMPFLLIGIIRKVKARFQNRRGPSLWQPLFNILRLWQKQEIISHDASWLFRAAAAVNLAVVIYLALLLPWLPFKPDVPGADIFLVIYLLALMRFFSVLAALDTGSPFGTFSSARELTLAVLTEPAIIFSFLALAISVHSCDLSLIFAVPQTQPFSLVPVWLLAGTGIFLASIVELSRMPIDDPSTHLELTMVHEAMVIENSGPNLALVELTYSIRLLILYGLTANCYVHALSILLGFESWMVSLLVVLLIPVMAIVTAVIESFSVKLAWRKNPEFIAYALTMSLLASLSALVKGMSG